MPDLKNQYNCCEIKFRPLEKIDKLPVFLSLQKNWPKKIQLLMSILDDEDYAYWQKMDWSLDCLMVNEKYSELASDDQLVLKNQKIVYQKKHYHYLDELIAPDKQCSLIDQGVYTVLNVLKKMQQGQKDPFVIALPLQAELVSQVAMLRALKEVLFQLRADDSIRDLFYLKQAPWHQTYFDSHVNLLRTCSALYSSFLAGADFVEVLPHDFLHSEKSLHSLRIAHMNFRVFEHEAHLQQSIDPVAGAYSFEILTLGYAEEIFKQVQAHQNHIDDFLQTEMPNRRLSFQASCREKINNRERILCGVNSYYNDLEAEVQTFQQVPSWVNSASFENFRLQCLRGKIKLKPIYYSIINPQSQNFQRLNSLYNFFSLFAANICQYSHEKLPKDHVLLLVGSSEDCQKLNASHDYPQTNYLFLDESFNQKASLDYLKQNFVLNPEVCQ